MIDLKIEALKQSLHYHYAMQPAIVNKDYKRATPDQIIVTAAKFEKFLGGASKTSR